MPLPILRHEAHLLTTELQAWLRAWCVGSIWKTTSIRAILARSWYPFVEQNQLASPLYSTVTHILNPPQIPYNHHHILVTITIPITIFYDRNCQEYFPSSPLQVGHLVQSSEALKFLVWGGEQSSPSVLPSQYLGFSQVVSVKNPTTVFWCLTWASPSTLNRVGTSACLI